jgi:hypothetical protein
MNNQRVIACLQNLPDLIKEVRELKKKIEELQSGKSR